MAVLKSVNFKEASVNVVRYSDIIVKERHRVLSIDHSVSKIIQKNEMYKSIFKSNLGRYACSSSMKKGFKSNPLGVNVYAVAAISVKFSEILESMGCYLSGWHVYDSGNGCYTISWSACDGDLYELDSSKLLYNITTGRVIEFETPFFGDTVEPYKTIEENLPKIIVSLRNISVPIDLFEVCIADNCLSEEGVNAQQGNAVVSYLMSEDIGNVENTSHVLNGVSVISNQNAFTQYPLLDGKYALIVVQ